jgi:hypothetical protein
MKLRKFPNCGPLTVFQTLNVIVWPAHGLEFDLPDLKQRDYICQPRKVLQTKIQASNISHFEMHLLDF